MDVVFPRCAGLDVHKKSITACRIVPDPTGQEAEGIAELRVFGTMTLELLALADWLTEASITHVAMESTGEYWTPVYNLLEGTFTVFLVNAAHVKNVPGRKTDKADARWLAKLMRFGLLQASFIPPKGQRDVRDLTRYRTKLVQERVREVNRVQGVLERANIKLASVASDIMGVSGRAMLEALVAGKADPATMADLAKRRMRSKIPLLEQALTGVVRDHHRQLLAMQLAHIDFLDEQIDALNNTIETSLRALSADEPPSQQLPPRAAASSAAPLAGSAPLTFPRAVELLDTIPGVDQRGAEVIVTEIGIDMSRFETAPRLAAWAGVAPGNDESAGKQRSGKTRKGNRSLRAILTQLAHAAVRTKGTYLSALYQRLAARRGKPRAIIAVAHSMMRSVFHMLSRNEAYRELGANYFDERRRHSTVDRLARRIEHLGYWVSLEPVAAPAA
jgi:transposase